MAHRALSLTERDELCMAIGLLDGIRIGLKEDEKNLLSDCIRVLTDRLADDDELKFRQEYPGVYIERCEKE